MDDIKEAWREGFKAYELGLNLRDNPYTKVGVDDDLWEAWNEGFVDAVCGD